MMETGTMAEQRPPQRDASARGRRGHISRRLIGIAYLAPAVAALFAALVTWWIGRLNPGSRDMDEGQRAMNWAAQSDAFYVAYLGLYALFFSVIFFPALRDAMPVAIGVLLLLITGAWLGGYMWRRWRP
jgi:hypothetical protein